MSFIDSPFVPNGKQDRATIPAGQENKFFSAEEWNNHICQPLLDLRSHILNGYAGLIESPSAPAGVSGLSSTVLWAKTDGNLVFTRGVTNNLVAAGPVTAKGDLLVFNGVSFVKVAAGSNGQLLQADSTASSGVKWATGAQGSGAVISWTADKTWAEVKAELVAVNFVAVVVLGDSYFGTQPVGAFTIPATETALDFGGVRFVAPGPGYGNSITVEDGAKFVSSPDGFTYFNLQNVKLYTKGSIVDPGASLWITITGAGGIYHDSATDPCFPGCTFAEVIINNQTTQFTALPLLSTAPIFDMGNGGYFQLETNGALSITSSTTPIIDGGPAVAYLYPDSLSAAGIEINPATPEKPIWIGAGITLGDGRVRPLPGVTVPPFGNFSDAARQVAGTLRRSDATAAAELEMSDGLVWKKVGGAKALGWFDVRDFQAVGDATFNSGTGIWSGTDDTSAFQAAFNACKAAGGGTVYAVGKFMLTAGVLTYNGGGNDDQRVVLRGAGTETILVADCAPTDKLIIPSNLDSFAITDLVIVGSDQLGGAADCNKVVYATEVTQLIMERVTLIGLQCPDSMVAGLQTGLCLRDCSFYGCAVTNSLGAKGLVFAKEFPNATIEHCNFTDFGNLDGYNYSKTPTGMPAWIYVEDATLDAAIGEPGGGSFIIRNCGFDEGATQSIIVNSSNGIKSTGHIRITGNSFLNSALASIYVGLARSLVMEQNTFNIRNAVNFIPFYGDVIGSLLCRDMRVIGAGSVRFGLDASTAGSGPAEFINCDRMTGGTFAAFVGSAPPIYITAGGVRARLRVADGTVIAKTLGKASTAVAGRVTQFLAADAATPQLVTCTILDDGLTGAIVRCVEQEGQQVQLKSDGVAIIPIGSGIDPSPTVDGRVRAGAGVLGYNADAQVAATLDVLAEVL
jgi:hypothetical protein